MGEIPGSTHSEFTPVKVSHRSDMRPNDDVEGAIERLLKFEEYMGRNEDLHALLTDWRQRGEIEDRLCEEIVALRDDLEAEAAALSETRAVLKEVVEALEVTPRCVFCSGARGDHTGKCVITRAKEMVHQT